MNSELSLLYDEAGTNTQSANTGSIVVSDDPQLSFNRHLLNLLYELALVSVEEVMEHNISGEFFRKGGRRGKFPRKNDALTGRKVLDEDLTCGEGLEFRGELLHVERNKAFFLR